MDMESIAGELSIDHFAMIRKKRFKRRRSSSPLCATPSAKAPEITSSYSSGGADGGSGSNSFSIHHYSPSVCSDFLETTKEEDELVECLMLLAKGICPMEELHKTRQQSSENFSSPRFSKIVHECKFCYRIFPSGQALGGHQTSHTKLKFTQAENIERSLALLPPLVNTDGEGDRKYILAQVPLQMISGKGKGTVAKIHECSICGEKFLSGQALGGHMGRHRTTYTMKNSSAHLPSSSRVVMNISDSSEDVENQSKGLLLDLNLPAPEFDHRDSNCELASTSSWFNL